jgi:exodeoxyribonuclease V beta subunit
LLRHGLAATPAHLAQTSRLVSRALNVILPGDVRLCALPHTRQLREMAFHFRLRPTRIDAVHALLQAQGYPRARKPAQATLDGLMQGYIDLVYRDPAGRHYVLDYKTNRLPAYDPDSLSRAIRAQDYDLQYLIYLVALRRWLRLRRGARYDDARDLGGAVYLFLRGIDAAATPTDAAISRAGVHFDPVSPALLATLDALFDGVATDGAR